MTAIPIGGRLLPVPETGMLYDSVIINDGAVAYWRLDESSGTTVTSKVGGYTGTISGGVTLNQPGALADGNRAMAFDGVNGSVVIPYGVYKTFGTGPVSIECWFRATAANNFKSIVDCKNDGDASQAGVSLTTGDTQTLYVEWCDGVVGDIAGVAFSYADGTWHHLVGTLTRGASDVARLYVDGIERASKTLAVAGISLTSAISASIGKAGAAAVAFAQGQIDEVAIYHTALTPQQILDHYNRR